jgi:SAM-dependent methyltransferase
MRTTWDAAADSDRVEHYVGDPATARSELESLFSRLGGDPHGGVCVEVGCGFGRMSAVLAEGFDLVLAVDVSPRMLDLARAAVTAPNVEFVPVSGTSLEPVEDCTADAIVCYLVLQHLPRREVVAAYLKEFARVLAPVGLAFVQLPVLVSGAQAQAWRLARGLAVPLLATGGAIARRPAYRGYRLTEAELDRDLEAAGLRVAARDESPTSPYRYAREVFLKLERSR